MEKVTSMGKTQAQEQFLHHQFGLRFVDRNIGTPIGGEYIPSNNRWSNSQFQTLFMAMRQGQSWTADVVKELSDAGIIPVMNNGWDHGVIDRDFILQRLEAEHNADPMVMWEIDIPTVCTEQVMVRTKLSEVERRDTLVQGHLEPMWEAEWDEKLFRPEGWTIEHTVIPLEQRYDHWLAYFRPIPYFSFSGQQPVDLQIEVSASDLPLGINEKHIWTKVWSDNCELILPGIHWLNRLSYYVTETPWTDKHEHYEVID